MIRLSQTCRSDRGVGPATAAPSRSGFTLVELLVVMAVIAILAAMLLPVLSRAKEQGYNAVCKGNLRQMGIALANYTGEHQCYPFFEYLVNAHPPLANGNLVLWPDELEPYSGAKWTSRSVLWRSGLEQSTLPMSKLRAGSGVRSTRPR